MKFIIKMGNEKEIRWGFIGCGEVTEKKSGPAFSKIEGSKVVAVMSRSHEKASSYAHRHHISRWYTDAQQLIEDPEVNAVYIATPPSSHATYAIMAMKAGKPGISQPDNNGVAETPRMQAAEDFKNWRRDIFIILSFPFDAGTDRSLSIKLLLSS